MQRIVHVVSVMFWISVPLLGTVLILPWLRIDWLQDVLAVAGGASAVVLVMLTYIPGYISPASLSIDGERFVYVLVLFFAMSTFAA
jgi:hypothetical protein